jgi:hypothetical protein
MGKFQKLQITCMKINENVLALFFKNVIILKEKSFLFHNLIQNVIDVIPLIAKKINLT